MPKRGLSPQVRGTAQNHHRNSFQIRFIPAGAGNRTLCPLIAPSVTVYPRRCGEQRWNALTTLRDTGLSPQVRGTGFPRRVDSCVVRFIPAGAGNRRDPRGG